MADKSQFDALPQTIVTTSLLPFLSTDDWLQFRTASRGCYEIVHGTNDVSHSYCRVCQSSDNINEASESNRNVSTNEEAENLWNMALVREYRFEIGGDNLNQSIHSPKIEVAMFESFLSTRGVFTASSSFVSWKHWRKIEARRGVRQVVVDGVLVSYPNSSRCKNPCRQTVGPYYLRAASMWKKIEDWCDEGNVHGVSNEQESHDDEDSPDLHARLRRDVRRSFIDGIDVTRPIHRLGFDDDDVITALSAVYSFYSAQASPVTRPLLHGFFGGYSAYDFGCMMEWFHAQRFGFSSREQRNHLIIACDCMQNLNNLVVMDVKSGSVLYINQPSQEVCHAIKRRHDEEESLLLWFEEHARRLSTGYYSIGQFGPRMGSLSILHYPSSTERTMCSRAVTRGVEVVASSTFHPFSNISHQGIHIYSIRLRLLTPDDGDEYVSPEQRGFTTCQLHSRHWIITKQSSRATGNTRRVEEGRRDEPRLRGVFQAYSYAHPPLDAHGSPVTEEVRGEGVVGEYPLLSEGGFKRYHAHGADAISRLNPESSLIRMETEPGVFSYQSCTDALSTAFGGYLTFVPGSLFNPDGEPFQVRVAPFQLCCNPDFYY